MPQVFNPPEDMIRDEDNLLSQAYDFVDDGLGLVGDRIAEQQHILYGGLGALGVVGAFGLSYPRYRRFRHLRFGPDIRARGGGTGVQTILQPDFLGRFDFGTDADYSDYLTALESRDERRLDYHRRRAQNRLHYATYPRDRRNAFGFLRRHPSRNALAFPPADPSDFFPRTIKGFVHSDVAVRRIALEMDHEASESRSVLRRISDSPSGEFVGLRRYNYAQAVDLMNSLSPYEIERLSLTSPTVLHENRFYRHPHRYAFTKYRRARTFGTQAADLVAPYSRALLKRRFSLIRKSQFTRFSDFEFRIFASVPAAQPISAKADSPRDVLHPDDLLGSHDDDRFARERRAADRMAASSGLRVFPDQSSTDDGVFLRDAEGNFIQMSDEERAEREQYARRFQRTERLPRRSPAERLIQERFLMEEAAQAAKAINRRKSPGLFRTADFSLNEMRDLNAGTNSRLAKGVLLPGLPFDRVESITANRFGLVFPFTRSDSGATRRVADRARVLEGQRLLASAFDLEFDPDSPQQASFPRSRRGVFTSLGAMEGRPTEDLARFSVGRDVVYDRGASSAIQYDIGRRGAGNVFSAGSFALAQDAIEPRILVPPHMASRQRALQELRGFGSAFLTPERRRQAATLAIRAGATATRGAGAFSAILGGALLEGYANASLASETPEVSAPSSIGFQPPPSVRESKGFVVDLDSPRSIYDNFIKRPQSEGTLTRRQRNERIHHLIGAFGFENVRGLVPELFPDALPRDRGGFEGLMSPPLPDDRRYYELFDRHIDERNRERDRERERERRNQIFDSPTSQYFEGYRINPAGGGNPGAMPSEKLSRAVERLDKAADSAAKSVGALEQNFKRIEQSFRGLANGLSESLGDALIGRGTFDSVGDHLRNNLANAFFSASDDLLNDNLFDPLVGGLVSGLSSALSGGFGNFFSFQSGGSFPSGRNVIRTHEGETIHTGRGGFVENRLSTRARQHREGTGGGSVVVNHIQIVQREGESGAALARRIAGISSATSLRDSRQPTALRDAIREAAG